MCRTYNGFDINGMGQKKDGRGNICPVTIILPTIAMEAATHTDTIIINTPDGTEQRKALLIDRFFEILEKTIEEARDMLLERYKFICSQSAKSAPFMYENATMEGYDPEEGIESALKHGTLAIGQLGLAECLQILIGTNQTTSEGMDLAKSIECLFKSLCKEYKEKYRLNFGVYYTPAESLCYTAMKKFKEKYGVIPNVSDREYFTNSVHVPVWEKMDGFTKIDIESQLTGYSNAGCITYVEMPANAHHNIDALEKLVNYAMDKDIPYFAINVPDDRCIDCGAVCTDLDTCPECGSTKIARLKRVTGYITGDYEARFNFGKYKEAGDREKHFGYEVQ